MKSAFRIFLLLAVVFSSGIMISCEPDSPIDSDPNDPRNEFKGLWRFTETGKLKSGSSVTQSYIVSIYLDPDNSSQVLLNNFGNPGSSDKDVIGIVTSNQIVVTGQTLDNGWLVQGSGEKSGTNQMTWSYSITAGGDINYYSATATKQ